jgi:hypothetical protein
MMAVIGFFNGQAQSLEGGILLGCSNYNGDLSGTLIDFSQTKASGGILIRYNIDQRWTLKGYFGYGRISGADSLSTSNAYNHKRNLSFYTDIFEVSGQFEYNLIRVDNRYYSKRPWVPYVFAGLGIYNFNPKALLAGKEYELQPLSTEGQGTTQYNDLQKYALTQVCMPIGIGVKKKIALRWTIGAEIGVRYTFTNYLDDVGGIYANNNVIGKSTGEIAAQLADRSSANNGGVPQFAEGDKRSNKKFKVNDMYIFSGITLTFKLKGKTHCPRFN